MENNQTSEVSDGTTCYGIKKDVDFIKKETKSRKVLRVIFYTILSATFYSVSFHYLVQTCNFAPGGISGILAMVKHVLNIDENAMTGFDFSALIMVVLNIPILLIATRSLQKEFIFNTALNVLSVTAILVLLDNVDKDCVFTITQKPSEMDVGVRLVAAIIGGALSGISLAFALKINASTGGADVIGAMVQKKNPHKSVASMIFAVNCVILIISIYIYKDNLMPVFLSLVYMFVSSTVCDKILQGSKEALKFEVITEHAEEISEEIIKTLRHGVTITPAKGMFEHKNKSLLICVIKPRQIAKFQSIIAKYPETFAYVGQVNEIIGKFNSKR
ncbi:MAG: YitT family protein [Clostridia bacterium]|nr:YitT family protein [Clostridia bacterium]